ncbi:MAG: hypothetical protein C5B46_08505 [Proteobacteria bacterium]|nr:MAG: hypothetical protein C5B46_08505 [Pseudomonadota bacterium]
MNPKFRVVIASAVVLLAAGGCASNPSPDPYPQWEAFREHLLQDQANGKLKPSEVQIQLRDEYRHRFGLDPEAAGFYAFSISLLESAEHGQFPLDEAQVMIRAKEAQMVATRAAIVRGPRPEVNDASD